jgi:hypothetical protein
MTKKTTKKATKKAKTRAKRSGKATPRAMAPSEQPSSQGEPVTLDEAKALAQVPQPRRAMRRAEPERQTLATLGEKRKELRERREQEREQRIRDYKATMAIMKRRGAKAPRPKPSGKGRRRALASAPPSFRPLQVFAEGDSWFDYPVPFFGGGIIPRLERLLGVPILNLADAGDEVRFMLGVEQRKRLVKTLTQGCPAGGPWDALLFSGGGNDIVDNPMALWIRDFEPATQPADHINQQRFNAALGLVRAGYEDLIELRDKLSPNTQLIFHGYDFAIPDGRGICFLGPWLKPAFDMHNFPSRDDGFAVVKLMLAQFAALLKTFAAKPKVTFISTQGTLAPQTSSWHNELHPAKRGFDSFAELFHQQLKSLFPDRVL